MTSVLLLSERSVSSLKAFLRNARKHPQKQIDEIARSIAAFGFNVPILIDADGEIIAGHGRLAAAERLNLETVPVITLPHLNDAQKRAFRLADNRITENGTWDLDLVAEELKALSTLEMDLDFRLTTELGFSEAELDLHLGCGSPSNALDQIHAEDISAAPVSRLGDCFQVGRHVLLCADAREARSYEVALQGRMADLVITDVPYNVRIGKNVSGKGEVQHPEFVMATGEMNQGEYRALLRSSLAAMAEYSRQGAIHYIFIDWRHIEDLQQAVAEIYSELLNICVWNKNNAGMGSLYRSKHEFVLVQKVGTADHVNNVQLGRHGRHRTNIWDYAGCTSFGPHRKEALSLHPTVKPVALIADAIQDCSRRGDLVLDGFCGSGTTLLAAEQTGRAGCGIELDPRYIDVTINRWIRHTGQEAVLLPDKIRWSDLCRQRAIAFLPSQIELSSRDAR